MKMETVLVTPEMARDFLKRNNGNRNVRTSWVNELARRITNGEWRMTHQGAAIDSDGNLLDGQHRFLAIIKADTPVNMIVVKGCDAENPIDFPVDDGVRRTHADTLGINKSITETAAFIGRILHGVTPSTSRVSAVLDAFQPTIENLLSVCATAKRGRSAAAVRAAVCVLANRQNEKATLNNYRAFVLMEFEGMPPSLLSLTRQVDDGLRGRDHFELFARSWLAFDESRLQLQKLIVKDVSAITAEARDVIRRMMESQTPVAKSA